MAFLALVLVALEVAPSMANPTVAVAKPNKRTPTPTPPTPAPDFLLRYSTYGYTDRAYVVRGGLPTCSLCAATWEPRFIDTSSEVCFYGPNHFTLTSLNGFEGTVYIGASSIAPNGVTSEIPNTVFIPRGETVLVPFVLKAASDASGSGLVLVQAIGEGGSTPTHSIYHEVIVVDQMPLANECGHLLISVSLPSLSRQIAFCLDSDRKTSILANVLACLAGTLSRVSSRSRHWYVS